MKKSTIVIASTGFYTFILLGILAYRIMLINSDTSGLYQLKDESLTYYFLTFLPEISIVLTIFAAWIKKGLGLLLTALSGFVTLGAFLTELFIKIVKSSDIVNKVNVPPPCVPWLNIPVIIIVILLFIFKFHIYNLPEELTFIRKKTIKKKIRLF